MGVSSKVSHSIHAGVAEQADARDFTIQIQCKLDAPLRCGALCGKPYKWSRLKRRTVEWKRRAKSSWEQLVNV